MALQAIRDSLEGLAADVAKEYTKGDDGKFHLDVEGLEDTGALKRSKDHEKARRQKAEQALTEMNSKLEDLQNQLDNVGENGKLDDKLKLKLEKQITELTAKLTAREGELVGEISRLTATQAAEQLAAKLSDSPGLMLPHLKSRVVTEMVDGKAVVKVKDPDGEVGVMSLADLEKEIRANKEYAPILRGSQGSGSGAPGSGSGGGQSQKPLDYSKASPKEIAEHLKAKKGV